MSESNWDFFFYRRGEPHVTTVTADLAAATSAAKAARPLLLTIVLPLKQPRPDGLPESGEFETLHRLEQAWMVRLDNRPNAQLVGSVGERGHRVWYFYVKSAEGAEPFIDAAANAAGYSVGIEVGPDPAWSTYHMVLEPNDVEFREILDRRVLMRLHEQGDDLSQSRGIQHWAYFARVDDRDRFLVAARHAGFACAATDPNGDAGAAHPFGATCHRVDRVAPPDVHAVVAQLVALAERFGGEYDGWETQIVKPGQTPKEDRPKDAT